MAIMPLSAGARLGPYQIVALLGAGGMGEVYRARDPRIGREVAIKVLAPSFSGDADRLRRFEQEARAAGTLNHPNVLAIYDVGTQDGAPYLVSELLEGQTLRSRLGSALAVRKAIDYALQVVHGLSAAHEKGIVHRDLKPENIFITKEGHVKILDFGLAKLSHPEIMGAQQSELSTIDRTESGVVLGTVGYMSPEQVSGRRVDHRSDIFSFGAILYEMLSGRKAFRGERPVEKMNAILNEEPAPLSGTSKNISPALERIVVDCLGKKPEERFQSARDLALALEAISMTSEPSSAAPGISRKRRWLPVVVSIILVAGIVSAFFTGKRVERALTKIQPASQPKFQRLTFRRGTIYSARFAPDGHIIVYSAAWEGKPPEIYSSVPESGEYRSLGLSNAGILSISRTGEMAILLHCRYVGPDIGLIGTLARVSMSGGAPRELTENVISADWTPDGRNLAAVRQLGGTYRLEFPIGKTLYETPNIIRDVRVSPKGSWIAFLEARENDNAVIAIDQTGKMQTLSRGWALVWGLAWSHREMRCSSEQTRTFCIPKSFTPYRFPEKSV